MSFLSALKAAAGRLPLFRGREGSGNSSLNELERELDLDDAGESDTRLSEAVNDVILGDIKGVVGGVEAYKDIK